MNRSEIDQFCKTKSKKLQYYKHYFFFDLLLRMSRSKGK